MDYRPFNLEEALAGKPVVTRNGKPVTEIHLFKTTDEDAQPLRAVIGGAVHSFAKSGHYLSETTTSHLDLFMKPVEHSFWTNIFENGCIASYRTKELADSYARYNKVIACIETKYYL